MIRLPYPTGIDSIAQKVEQLKARRPHAIRPSCHSTLEARRTYLSGTLLTTCRHEILSVGPRATRSERNHRRVHIKRIQRERETERAYLVAPGTPDVQSPCSSNDTTLNNATSAASTTATSNSLSPSPPCSRNSSGGRQSPTDTNRSHSRC
jgi:hypothetical protein